MNELVGHSGLTYRDWQYNVIQDFLAGRRETLPRYSDFLKEFVAYPNGVPVVSVVSCVTGEDVQLPEPLLIGSSELGSFISGLQSQSVAEWNVQNPDRVIGGVDDWRTRHRAEGAEADTGFEVS